MTTHKLDTETQVFFYEQEFYVLSNFSAFSLQWEDLHFPTVEHAYQWAKFDYIALPTARALANLKTQIRTAPSAHLAFTVAHAHGDLVNPAWKEIRVQVMRALLRAKVAQHEYVRRKLLETGNRTVIEDSWRDAFWGWGPGKTGVNMLGRLWMEIRSALQQESDAP